MKKWLWLAMLLGGCTPVVWISDDGADLSEPDGQCVVTVHRDDSGRSPITVNLSYDGAEGDYSGAVRSIVVEPGQYASASFTLTAIDDDLVEPEKLLTVSIAPSQSYQIGEQASVMIAVTSDDEDEPPPPDPSFDELGKKVAEWKAALPLGQASAIGEIYMDVARRLDAMEIGSIGQAGVEIANRIASVAGDRAAWDAMAGKINDIYRKYNVSDSREDVVKFFRIVGEAMR